LLFVCSAPPRSGQPLSMNGANSARFWTAPVPWRFWTRGRARLPQRRRSSAAVQDAVALDDVPLRFMAPMHDFEIVEASHEPERKDQGPSLSCPGPRFCCARSEGTFTIATWSLRKSLPESSSSSRWPDRLPVANDPLPLPKHRRHKPSRLGFRTSPPAPD